MLASYTFLLEFMRRHLFQYPKLSANLGVLLLGLYQNETAKEIDFNDFERVLKEYDVNITQEEAVPLFIFLSRISENV